MLRLLYSFSATHADKATPDVSTELLFFSSSRMDLNVLSRPRSYSLPELVTVYILTWSRTQFGYEL